MEKVDNFLYSINDGNQSELIFAPDFDVAWFKELDEKYSWDNFKEFDNRYFEYMYALYDTLPSLAKGKASSRRDYFNKLTRGQKVFYSILAFGGDTDNGGVYQFFTNRFEMSYAVLEAFAELRFNKLYLDYGKCLEELFGTPDHSDRIKELLTLNETELQKHTTLFSEGKASFSSSKTIEDYFYSKEFKKLFYKTVVDYIDNNLDQFVKR